MDQALVEATVEVMVERMRPWLGEMVAQALTIGKPAQAADWEERFRQGVREQAAAAMSDAFQAAIDAGDGGRRCPGCGQDRRHKGRRPRTLITTVGEVHLQGVYWVCARCGCKGHAAGRVADQELLTRPMRELVCLLGVTQDGFAHASAACAKLLGVSLSTPTIAAATEDEGRRALAADTPPQRLVNGTLVGSCDGTMVNTREGGWRELKAFRFDDDAGRRLSGAALEDAEAFMARLRERALLQHADQVKRFVFVSDAAEWIRLGVAEHLPEVSAHVVDLYHACGHVHEAARAIHGEGTAEARAWAKRWRDELYTRGGAAVRHRLRRARFKDPPRQAALEALLAYLRRNQDRMDYPRYRGEGIPISSGAMESTCKQMGLRLKGPGMRWREENLTPMATLIGLWCDRRWDAYWKQAA